MHAAKAPICTPLRYSTKSSPEDSISSVPAANVLVCLYSLMSKKLVAYDCVVPKNELYFQNNYMEGSGSATIK